MHNILKQNYINYKNTWENIFFRADLHLIWGCNFKCIMCDNWKREVKMDFSYEDILKFLLVLKKHYKCNYIRLHGQEPTMYDKLENVIWFAKKIWMKVAIKTNAWLLSDRRLAVILNYWLDELYLSIDWPNEIIHDEIRWKKWSFKKNVDVIIKSKKINKNLKIYVNSVVMKQNFKYLSEMIDFWSKYKLDRISFVFLNDKNRKDISWINLNKKDFFNFFKKEILNMYKKSKEFSISVDFSPFISRFSWETNDFIIWELENNFYKYKNEINSFYKWDYWKYFYDRYWCFWPIDHCSINYNWDIYWCCVVERDSGNSVWNILKEDLSKLWDQKKYINYRNNSNWNCSYWKKCASNFYARKILFRSIYLDDDLYNKNESLNYYRYLKELFFEEKEILEKIKIDKLRNILLHFYNNLTFYRQLLEKNNIFKKDIQDISDFSILEKLPILDKKILKNKYDEIKKLSEWKKVLNWKTSGNSGNTLEFVYPLDFKRHIKQIAIFSQESDFTYNDTYFSITPINCNQKIVNNIIEPDYVKKIYISISKFDFDKNYFLKLNDKFQKNKNTRFLHWDSKYILYLILWFDKYNLSLPRLSWISITYSYTNKSLKKFIKKSFNCELFDNYWCSEVWPISIDEKGKKKIFWDNILFWINNGEFIVSDLDNYYFPFLNYKNWDLWKYDWEEIIILWKQNQQIYWKNLLDIDNFFYKNFKEIFFYQFENENLIYFSNDIINEELLNKKLYDFLNKRFEICKLSDSEYFKVWECSKFKFINI